MDPEMVEYCKKIEEQKRIRERVLQEKEKRRRITAMEKAGTKKPSLLKSTGLLHIITIILLHMNDLCTVRIKNKFYFSETV